MPTEHVAHSRLPILLLHLRGGQAQSVPEGFRSGLRAALGADQLDGGAGVTGCFKLSYLHGMKLAMVTRSDGWNPGPQ